MKFHEKALKGSLSQKARYRERNTGGSSLRKRDPTCPGALYDKYSEIPALRINKRVSATDYFAGTKKGGTAESFGPLQ